MFLGYHWLKFDTVDMLTERDGLVRTPALYRRNKALFRPESSIVFLLHATPKSFHRDRSVYFVTYSTDDSHHIVVSIRATVRLDFLVRYRMMMLLWKLYAQCITP